MMSSERAAVIELWKAGKRSCDILRTLSFSRARESFVRKTIQRYQETGGIADRPRSGRPRAVRNPQLRRTVAQQIRRNPRRSQRSIARNVGVSRSTITRLLRQDLGLTAYRLQKAQLLSAPSRQKRLQRCQWLLQRFSAAQVDNIIFCDEKIFTLQEQWNPQNNRVYAASLADLPVQQRTLPRAQHPTSVMVWAAVCSAGKLPLHIIPQGTTVDRFYYRDQILQQVLLPGANLLYPNQQWTFIQDGAPPHTARITQQWCATNLPDFVAKDDWPPSSPDLNPLDYAIWSSLQASVSAVKHPTVALFQRVLQRQWQRLSLDTVRNSINAWRDRLRQCVRARGGLFEK